MLKVFTNDYEWVIAQDVNDVWTILEKEMGILISDIDDIEWRECNPNSKFPIFNEELNATETLTFAEWIEKHGRGYLATTEL